MKAALDLSCSCNATPPLHDDNVGLSDALAINTWTMLHRAPGHVVTATIVADYNDGGADFPGGTVDAATGLFHTYRNLVGLVRRLLP